MTRWDAHKFGRDAYNAGIRYIGGCCGIEPYHIRAVAEEVEYFLFKINRKNSFVLFEQQTLCRNMSLFAAFKSYLDAITFDTTANHNSIKANSIPLKNRNGQHG